MTSFLQLTPAMAKRMWAVRPFRYPVDYKKLINSAMRNIMEEDWGINRWKCITPICTCIGPQPLTVADPHCPVHGSGNVK